MDEGLQHLLDGAGGGAGLRAELSGAALLRRVRAVGVPRHRAEPRNRRQSPGRLPPRREERRAVDADLPLLPLDRRQHHLQQDRAVAEHAGALARLAGAAADPVHLLRRIGSSSIRGRRISSPPSTTSAARISAGSSIRSTAARMCSTTASRTSGASATAISTAPRSWSRRYGEATFPVDVLVTFAERRARRPSTGTARIAGRCSPTTAWPGVVSAQVDPNRVLLLDVNYTNNSRTLEPRGGTAATKWSMNWMVWLQDCLLSWTALA